MSLTARGLRERLQEAGLNADSGSDDPEVDKDWNFEDGPTEGIL